MSLSRVQLAGRLLARVSRHSDACDNGTSHGDCQQARVVHSKPMGHAASEPALPATWRLTQLWARRQLAFPTVGYGSGYVTGGSCAQPWPTLAKKLTSPRSHMVMIHYILYILCTANGNQATGCRITKHHVCNV